MGFRELNRFVTAFSVLSVGMSFFALEGIQLVVYWILIMPSLVLLAVAGIAFLTWSILEHGFGVGRGSKAQNTAIWGTIGIVAGAASAYLPLRIFADPQWTSAHIITIAVLVVIVPGLTAGIFTGATCATKAAV